MYRRLTVTHLTTGLTIADFNAHVKVFLPDLLENFQNESKLKQDESKWTPP